MQLDTFIRANEDPLSHGGDWGAMTSGSQLKLVSNAAVGRSGQNTRSAWDVETFGPDFTLECGVSLMNSISAQTMYLIGRAGDIGTGTWDAYLLAISENGGGVWSMGYLKIVNGADSTIGSTAVISGSTSQMRMVMTGTTLEGWTFDGTSGWVQRVTLTDSTHTGAGYVGIGGFGDTWKFQTSMDITEPTPVLSFDGIFVI